jgi:hypothetical protein
VDSAFTQVLSDIDSGTNVIIDRLSKIYKNEKTPIPLVKDNLKKYIQDLKSEFSSGIATNVQELTTLQENYIQIIRKLNVVTDKLDGKILETNVPRMYQISPTILEAPETGDSYTELIDDYIKLVAVFEDNPNGFNTILYDFYLAFRETYNDGDFRIIEENLFNSKSDKLFYMVMARIITDKNKKIQFIDSIIKGEELKTWNSPVRLTNKFEKIVNDLDSDYSKELRKEEKIFKDLRKDKKFKDLLDGLSDDMYEPGKPRKFNYTTAVDLTAEQSKIQDLYKTVNVNTDKTTFDGKITFNG